MTQYSDLEISEEEQNLIQALRLPDGSLEWEHADLAALRRRIRSHFLAVTSDTCAYCQRSLSGESLMIIDVEHILPKGMFPSLAVLPLNLTVSCRRCNFIKKARWCFVNGFSKDQTLAAYDRSETYQIAHPNLDVCANHLELYVVQRGVNRLIFYVSHTGKGRATHTFFDLRNLEVQILDELQGMERADSEIALQVQQILSGG